ncbi:MAG: bifunctional oligoribonuclease/PAP phosphatase NrnA [Deltaproteobacteria bacterium]|nr:bifunctional oligoribonuclease/PAP phosphatase NrnA [Deltaproteobacteria bacterium]
MDKRFDKAIEEIQKGKKFLVVSHVSPEGDAVGSLLGVALALRSIGKDATAYLEDPVPDLFKFLPGAETVVHSLEGAGPFDATFAVDCGQRERLGKGFVNLKAPGRVVNIDHHATNDCFGDVNVIVPDASAAGELVYDLCKAADIPINRDIAVNLYVAIHTDTGSFRYSSATSEAFIKAGELVRLGAEPWDISRRVYENHPARKYKLLGMVLSTLDIIDAANGGAEGNHSPKIATLVVTKDMFRQTGAEKDQADGFVNYARGIEGVDVGVLFRETGQEEYKVSMRSKGDVDVAEISQGFGGGGHRNAAGFTMKGSLDFVKTEVVAIIKERMRAALKV